MLFRSNDTATTEIYTRRNTLSLHDALPIAALGLALVAERLERSYFARICPAIEVHERGICFCDARRPVYFRELDGLLFSKSSVFLAFKKGLAKDEAAARAVKRPWWERAIRRRAYWEVPLEGFADREAVKRAIRDTSKLQVQELSDEIADAIRSRTTQGIARVPAAAIEQRF